MLYNYEYLKYIFTAQQRTVFVTRTSTPTDATNNSKHTHFRAMYFCSHQLNDDKLLMELKLWRVIDYHTSRLLPWWLWFWHIIQDGRTYLFTSRLLRVRRTFNLGVSLSTWSTLLAFLNPKFLYYGDSLSKNENNLITKH